MIDKQERGAQCGGSIAACRTCVDDKPTLIAKSTVGVSQNFASPSGCAT